MVAKMFPASNLLKNGVMNDKGENLGRIDELLVDIETGRISYAILSFGGFPNRTKYFTVPWELINYSTHDKKYILNVPRDTIVKGPGYDNMDKSLEAMDTYWLGDIYEYYSHKPEWEKRREEERQEELKRMQQMRDEVRHITPPPEPGNPPSSS
jgi:sporulation protein YlmC with PRC-barrel domain